MAKSQRKEKPDLRKELAERLMQQMENGEAFWQKPWEQGAMEMPHNAVTGKPYRGVNAQNLLIFSPDPADNRWGTYKQAEAAGWQVRKGEHGTPIEKWSEYTHKRTPEEIQAMREAGAKGEIEPTEKRLGVRYYNVFHASQIDGIPPREMNPEKQVERNNAVDERLPKLAENMGVAVQHSGSRAFYRPGEDRVNMPPVETFQTGRDHDTIFLHELSHSTGHENRLNRDLTGAFGSQKYAKEELRAELSAAMTALSLGLGFSPEAQQQEEGREVVAGVDNTARYLNNWLQALPEKDRQKELMGAISESQKISDYLMERTPELLVEQQILNKPQPEKENTMDTKIEQHYLVLTHRTDLKDLTDRDVWDKPDIQITAHPVQRVSGKLKHLEVSGFVLEHVKYGDILVESNKKLFWGDDEKSQKARDTLHDARGKQVDIALDKTGTLLSVTIENGPTVEQRFQGPAIPFGLLIPEYYGHSRKADKSFKGELVQVYGEGSVELKAKEGPLLVYGNGGVSSEATLKKMIGKQVIASAGKDRELIVKNLEHEKSLAR